MLRQRHTEEYVKSLIQTVSDIILILNTDRTIRYLSPSIESELGYRPEELIGKDIFDFVHPDDLQDGVAYFDHLIKNPSEIHSAEIRVRQRDGSWRILEGIGRNLLDNQAVRGVIINCRDITERAKIEDTLRESEERYRILFDQSPVGVYIFDRELKIIQCNKRMVDILQSSLDKILGLDMKTLNDRSFVPAMEEAIEGKSSYHEGLYNATTSCAKLWLSTHFSPLYDVGGRVIGGMGVVEDVTDRKQAEMTLKKLSSAVEQTADSVFITDKDGVIEYVNLAAEELTGYTKKEVIGKTPRILKSGKLDKKFYQNMWKIILSGNVFRGEFINMKKNGELYQQEETITPIVDSQRNITHFVSTGKDITEQRKLEEQLLHSQKMEAIGRLAGGIAHDFNNILTIIISFSDLLLLHPDVDDKERRYIKEIQDAGERAAALTNQLLAFSRKQVLQPKVLDLNSVIADVEKLIRRLIGEDIELVTTLESERACVEADPGQIEQVIMNLVINARDAMHKGGRLTLKTRNVYLDDEIFAQHHKDTRPGEYVEMAISDTGHGMDEKTISHIFEPFFTTKVLGKGTGLGLSTVYGIVKQSKGEITVNSEIGLGTTFRIYLPVVGAEPEEVKNRAFPPTEELPGGTETILIAEDEPIVRSIVCEELREKGYNVIEASDCDEAILICEKHSGPIHLLLTDIVMPKMSGPELAERLKSLRSEMKVIYMSGYTDNTVQLHEILEAGAPFLQKPFTSDVLLFKVREVLDTLWNYS